MEISTCLCKSQSFLVKRDDINVVEFLVLQLFKSLHVA